MDELLLSKIEKRVSALPSGLRDHISRVQNIAKDLAGHHGIDDEQASLGMLAHDVARAMTGCELLRKAAEFKLHIGIVERTVPVLLHGPVGAELLFREDGVTDPSLRQAVYWHTTAHPSLDTLGKLVFLADKLDPQKIAAYPYQSQLHQFAKENLDKAILEFLTREIASLVSRRMMVHPMVIETRNYFLSAATSKQNS